MPYPTLYPPQTNSPATELLYDISASDTGFTVPGNAVLPAAPCPLVIGFDDDAETVLCTEKIPVTIGASVVEYFLGVTRAFEGVAKAWSAGTPIARNLAAYDIRSLQEWAQANREAVEALDASSVPTAPIEGMEAATVQGALEELLEMVRGGSALIKTNITIPMSNWQDMTDTTALWFVDIPDLDVSENSIVSVFFEAQDVVNGARRAGIIETVGTSDGKFTLYATSKPSQDFVVKIKIEKGGV